MYTYQAKVTKVYDGDSITADIDLGFNMILTNAKLRMYGIDTPELRTNDETEKFHANLAKDHLKSLILNKTVTIQSHEKDKYGRYLCTVYYKNININQQMIRDAHAVEYFGGAKKPWIFL